MPSFSFTPKQDEGQTVGNGKSTARQLSNEGYREVLKKIFRKNEDLVKICMLIYKHFGIRFYMPYGDGFAAMGSEDSLEFYGSKHIDDKFPNWFMHILVPYMNEKASVPMFSSKNELKMKLEIMGNN